jgi:hypothetical protein
MKHGYLSNTNEFSSLSFDCAPCKLGKSKSLPFPLQGSCASTCFEIIHSDVCGMSPVLSHAQYRYFMTFIDDYSRFTWVYFLRSKVDVISTFKTFVPNFLLVLRPYDQIAGENTCVVTQINN